ncbi:MAG: PadR family transcriptional regulator [Ktedonobacterales bacterium]
MFNQFEPWWNPTFAGGPEFAEGQGQPPNGGWGGPRDGWGGPPSWAGGFAMRRGFFGPGGGFGPGGPGGPRGQRMFGRGDVKYVLLELLQERPKHGYEMIKELETQAGGFYTPSAGTIYPTLQLLEDRGWVTSQTVEGKKVFTLTDAGRAALAEHKQQQRHQNADNPFGGWGRGGPASRHHRGPGPFGIEMSPELDALRQHGTQVARLSLAAVMATNGDPERLAQLGDILAHTQGELEAFLKQSREQPREPAPAQSAESTPASNDDPNIL